MGNRLTFSDFKTDSVFSLKLAIIGDNELISRCVHAYLLQMGFLPNKIGFYCLFFLISSAVSGEELLPLKYNGYKRLSQLSGLSVQTVDKNIQNCISDAWLRGNLDVLYRDFGETVASEVGKPSNKQFILTAVQAISRQIGRT